MTEKIARDRERFDLSSTMAETETFEEVTTIVTTRHNDQGEEVEIAIPVSEENKGEELTELADSAPTASNLDEPQTKEEVKTKKKSLFARLCQICCCCCAKQEEDPDGAQAQVQNELNKA